MAMNPNVIAWNHKLNSSVLTCFLHTQVEFYDFISSRVKKFETTPLHQQCLVGSAHLGLQRVLGAMALTLFYSG